MQEKLLDSRVLRFQIDIGASEYQTVLAKLKGTSRIERRNRPQSRNKIRALIDLDLTTSSYHIGSVQNHKLPRSLFIEPHSETHQYLSSAISKEIIKLGEDHLPSALQEIIDSCSHISSTSVRIRMQDLSLAAPLDYTSLKQGLTIPILASLAPSLLLDIDDVPPVPLKKEGTLDTHTILSSVRDALHFVRPPKVAVADNTWTLQLEIAPFNLNLQSEVELYAHWGSYDDLSPPWSDELVTPIPINNTTKPIAISLSQQALVRGSYGLTFFISMQGSSERMWLGSIGSDDIRFTIECDDVEAQQKRVRAWKSLHTTINSELSSSLTDTTRLVHILSSARDKEPLIGIGHCLSSHLEKTTDENSSLTALVSSLFDSQCGEEIAEQLCTTYGLGEIVFISPEGPHAGAGGLAQVISGLPSTIAKNDLPVTVIAPLYAHANGNKHRSAQDVLSEGILIGDTRVIPTYMCSVRVDIGPTYYQGSSAHKRAPSSLICRVYLAQSDTVRFFLISNSSIFDRLYQPVYADEQLRRAIGFSRAALEVIAQESLCIKPSILISNDWMTAPVPALCALDSRYNQTPWLTSVKTVHMIHNGGADYHGRLPLHFGDEDLWPMFNLPPEHYFGFKDPYRPDLLNLTLAATQHVSGGILTVSQPYASDLLSDIGSDGLHYVLQHKKASVFGVSNGINRSHLTSYLSLRTNIPAEDLENVDGLLEAKRLLRASIQEQYGLTNDRDATILCMVGRLAEQKGLHLLSGNINGTLYSTLEDILIHHPHTQLLIAGPLTSGDSQAEHLSTIVHYLRQKYPGRVGTEFSYLSHSSAIDIIAGSSLFLMPSRFEPGGIAQLEALAVGTPVIGRGVGGIQATIQNFDPTSGKGTGFLCYNYDPTAFARTVHWALSVCEDHQTYRSLVQQAYAADHSWDQRSAQFTAVLQNIALGHERMNSLAPLAEGMVLALKSRAWTSS
jgi:starch synthase